MSESLAPTTCNALFLFKSGQVRTCLLLEHPETVDHSSIPPNLVKSALDNGLSEVVDIENAVRYWVNRYLEEKNRADGIALRVCLEIRHAEMNGHTLDPNSQGVGFEPVPAVRIDHLKAAIGIPNE